MPKATSESSSSSLDVNNVNTVPTNDDNTTNNNTNTNNNDNNHTVERTMIPNKPEHPKNAYANSSLLSKLFFTWPYKLLVLGMERPLNEYDLPEILDADTSEYALQYYYTKIWNTEQHYYPNNPSLHRAVVRDFITSIWYIHPFMLLGAIAKVIQALALGKLIESFNNYNPTAGYKWASVLVACGCIILFEHHHVFMITWRKGMQLRLSFVAAIYDKSLQLSSIQHDPTMSFGHVTNLASNDVERFLMCALFVSYLVWAPIQAIAILGVGIYEIGIAFAVGFGTLVFLFVPLQFYLGNQFAIYRNKIASITDKRVNFVSQAVRGARVMKMNGYELKFLNRIMHYRNLEITKISYANILKAFNEAIFFATNVVISLIILMVKVAMGGTLKGGEVYTVFTLINILQLEMTKHVSLAVMSTSELYVSIGRIQRFLTLPELPKTSSSSSSTTTTTATNSQLNNETTSTAAVTDDQQTAISMENVTCYWNNDVGVVQQGGKSVIAESTDDSSNATALITAMKDVTLQFKKGTVTAIIGSVGSGKSALLQALVGELIPSSGTIRRNYNTLSYASQDPWVMDGTVRENIIMGLQYDTEWYNQVIKACGLELDFQQLPRGDQTILGDRGVQCSGGQRARIGCARALYQNSDVLVLDDPLSAVDAKVGRQIYQEAILDLAVTKGKCVILATHQHQYVSDVTCVLLMSGQVQCVGSYEECVSASNGKLTAHSADNAVVDDLDTGSELSDDDNPNDQREKNVKLLPNNNNDNNDNDKKDVTSMDKADRDHQETSTTGVVTMDTYVQYLQAMGGMWIGLFLLFLFCATQGSVLVTVATIGRWSARSHDAQNDPDILGLMGGLGLLVLFLALFRAFISLRLTLIASQRLHDHMTKAVLRARIQFFDTNPLGRILNRFSADVGITDDQLPPTLFDFFVIAFLVLGALVTAVSTLPFILVALPFIGWYFVSVRKIFVTSSRELKRLESLARSPIFSMISESLGGIATIRGNNSIEFFKQKFRHLHDNHTRAVFSFIAASRWVGFRMDSIVFMLLAIVSFLAVLFNSQGWFEVDPSILGLSLSLLVQLAGLFQWCIRQSAEVVNQMVSVERMLEFGKIQSEAELVCEGDEDLNSSGWPSAGAISVENYSARYRDSLPLSLKDITFTIPKGARVGVVGRTGSGKSTLVQALFRLLEAETGRIVIDDIEIGKIGLHALRTKISVIPQVPTLFSGCTVRENIDLFAIHPDTSLRQVLTDCHLMDVIDELPNGWDTIVAEGGTNFSVGQRQLLCLARSILSKNRILIMDESTANVDRRTDQLLQEALKKSFNDGTIIAVAHRLDTIVDFDLCLVLGGGRLLEYGTPADLIRLGGAFASMVQDTGEAMSQDLRNRAFQKELHDKTKIS